MLWIHCILFVYTNYHYFIFVKFKFASINYLFWIRCSCENDCYSFGCLLYELLTLKNPFEQENESDEVYNVLYTFFV
jgi:serine/threonine protein kinase